MPFGGHRKEEIAGNIKFDLEIYVRSESRFKLISKV